MDLEIIKQSNKLTHARYNLTAMEQNLLLFIVNAMKKAKYQDLYYSIDIDYMLNKLEGDVRLSHLKDAAKKLMQRTMTIEAPDKSWLTVSFISSAEVNIFGFEVGIDKKVLPLYQQLEEYTTFELQTALDLRSKYAKRMYQILSQYKKGGYYSVEVKELKKTLGLIDPITGKEKYKNWGMFRKDVLDKSKEELDSTGDLYFDYKVIETRGKKIHRLYFTIYRDKSKTYKDMPVNEKQQALLVNQYQLSISQAQTILRQLDYEKEIQPVLKEIHQKYHNKEIHTSLGGYTAGVFERKYSLGFDIKRKDPQAHIEFEKEPK